METGGRDALSSENETGLGGSRKGKHAHAGERRVCRETVLRQRAEQRGRGASSGHANPPPSPPATRRLRGHSPYLLCGDHGDHVCSLLPHHLPEVVARVWQGPLGGYVVPFRPTDHHLETKESTGERTPNPGRNFLLTMGLFLIHLKTLDNIFLAKLVSATLNAEG